MVLKARVCIVCLRADRRQTGGALLPVSLPRDLRAQGRLRPAEGGPHRLRVLLPAGTVGVHVSIYL